jgi:hypothetical protein
LAPTRPKRDEDGDRPGDFAPLGTPRDRLEGLAMITILQVVVDDAEPGVEIDRPPSPFLLNEPAHDPNRNRISGRITPTFADRSARLRRALRVDTNTSANTSVEVF